jgi:signal transduction histidine kinase
LNPLRSLGVHRSTALGLLFFVVGILLPTASVLWFMNEAMTAQLAAARERVSEAYGTQLRLMAESISERWRARAERLSVATGEPPATAFARLVRAGLADAVIVVDAAGAPAYPQRPPSAFDARNDILARLPGIARARSLENEQQFAAAAAEFLTLARSGGAPTTTAPTTTARTTTARTTTALAAQGAIRNTLQQGDAVAAIGLIEEFFVVGDLRAARDPSGRHIAADELLLLLELLPEADARRGPTMERLVVLLNDYSVEMPAAQRLFLMEAAGAMAPGGSESLFPTYRAERLAQAYLTTASGIDPGAAALQATRQDGVWRLSFADGQGVALFATDSIAAVTADLLAVETHGAVFSFAPPGASAGEVAIAAGALLPGWQVGFALTDAELEAAANSRRVYYVWVGGIVVAAIAAAGILLLGAYRTQLRMAALKTDLVAAVSHELRTPLASMRLLVDTLLEHGTEDKARTRDYLELIARENSRLSRLIENFLEFSRLERQKQRFEFTAVSPASVVEAAASAVRERYEQAGCRLELAVEPGLPPIDADRDALTTVLVNLLDNALKYTGDDREIALRAHRAGTEVIFAVADNGIGIHARDRKKIFRRFYQVDRRLSRETGGVGLGLSIVDLIVRAHRGTVAVESEPGQGSVFSVRLPAREAA